MPLSSVYQPAFSNPENFNPTFPMKDGEKAVAVQVTTAALDKLGQSGDYVAACEDHRSEIESVASAKYDEQGGGDLVIVTADDF
jgi:hypothetical protein